MKHLRYLRYVLRHKWFVFVECCRLGIPLAGIVHDWTKFLPSEWGPYAAYFYGPRAETRADVEFGGWPTAEELGGAFDIAWNHHQHRNPHHWQYWILRNDNPGPGYGVWAHQPEVGPYFLGDYHDKSQGEPVAQFGFGYGCENPPMDTEEFVRLYRTSERIKDTLNCGRVTVLPMPDRYRREMLADWRGAGLALGFPDTAAWYRKNSENIILHPETRRWIEGQLGLVSYGKVRFRSDGGIGRV